MVKPLKNTLTLGPGKRTAHHPAPPGGVLVGVGEEGLSIVRYDTTRGAGLSQGVGRWLLEEGLYSSGNDFTSQKAKDPTYIGVSAMKNLWEGRESCLDEIFSQVTVWAVMNKNRPQGVLALFHAGISGGKDVFYKKANHLGGGHTLQVSVDRIGHLMAYVKPEYRQRGLLRWVLSSCALSEIEGRARQARSEGSIPLLGGTDAMGKLMANYTDIPLTGHMEYCPEMSQDLWGVISRRKTNPEKVHGVDQYLMDPKISSRTSAPNSRQRKGPR